MPIFEYRCETCQKTIEKITSTPLLEISCPVCGRPAQKAISVFSTTSSASPAGGGCGNGQGCGSGFT